MNFLPSIKDFALTFARRQAKESPYSYWDISEEELIARVCNNFVGYKEGYRDGVVLVRVDPAGFYSAVVELQDGDELVGTFKPRVDGEEPRKSLYAKGREKSPAVSVDVVLYNRAVLLEDGEPDSDKEWEIIAVNASPTDEEMPIGVDTLLANHFHLDGGTQTNLSNDELVAKLKESVEFWKNRALAAPER